MEKPMLIFTALNPIDLSRVLVLLKMDVSALMGYTGAMFKDFFGTAIGTIIAISTLILWIAAPCWFSVRSFVKKDL